MCKRCKGLLLLALLLALSVLPVLAQAADVASVTIGSVTQNYTTLDDAIKAANASTVDCEIKLLDDISYNSGILFNNPNATITLNIDHYTLSLVSTNGVYVNDFNGSNDLCAIGVYSKVKLKGDENNPGNIIIQNKRTGISVSAQNNPTNYPAHLELYDGVNIDASNGQTDLRGLLASYGGQVDIYGGSILTHNSAGKQGSSTIVAATNGYVRIYGGEFERREPAGNSWGGVLDGYYANEFCIYGGYFDGVLWGGAGPTSCKLLRYAGGYFNTTQSNFDAWTKNYTAGGMSTTSVPTIYKGKTYPFGVIPEVLIDVIIMPDSTCGSVTGSRVGGYGATVPLTAVPATGYVLEKWTSDANGNNTLSTATTYNATLPTTANNLTIYCFFKPDQPVQVIDSVAAGTLAPLNKGFKNVAYSGTITPEPGATMPSSITVKIGGNTLAASSYTYDPTFGTVSIPGQYVTDDIEVIAVCPKSYTVTGNVTGGTIAPLTATNTQNYTGTITPYTGRSLPNKVQVTVGNTVLVPPTQVTYNAITGAISIPAQYITNNITIQATCPAGAAASDIPGTGDETPIALYALLLLLSLLGAAWMLKRDK